MKGRAEWHLIYIYNDLLRNLQRRKANTEAVMKLLWVLFIVWAVPRTYGQSLALTECPERAAAQSAKMTEIVEVAHCLKAGDIDWLGDSAFLDQSKILQVAMRHDRKTYPGKDLIFVVVLERATKGDVFELRHEKDGAKQSYRIEKQW